MRVTSFVEVLRPRVVVVENVPGIRTLKAVPETGQTAIEVLEEQFRLRGYRTTVMLLNAADYGVPQFRLRSFLVAVQRDLVDDVQRLVPIPTHGPKREFAYISVHDALSDLPPVSNGATTRRVKYRSAPRNRFQRLMREGGSGLTDHVTTKHSPYVLKRFEQIPTGGNWQSIRHLMTNYADASRTHLNIYCRLEPSVPAKTIGNFRKAMLVHPTETRGLSLREAARLQSIPDWYSFVDAKTVIRGAVVPRLNAYQQQIGNAVSFVLTKQIVEHVVRVCEL